MLSMFRYVTPKALPITAAFTLSQKRQLCGNQAQDPMWIQADKAVEDFLQKHQMNFEPKRLETLKSDLYCQEPFDREKKSKLLKIRNKIIDLIDTKLTLLEQNVLLEKNIMLLEKIIELCYKNITPNIAIDKERDSLKLRKLKYEIQLNDPMLASLDKEIKSLKLIQLKYESKSTDVEIQKSIKQLELSPNLKIWLEEHGFLASNTLNYQDKEKKENEIIELAKSLFKKHKISHEIHIFFISDISSTLASATSNALYIHPRFFDYNRSKQIAIIEHEIGHIICNDSLYKEQHQKFLDENPLIKEEYLYLTEQRADTHTAIQSLDNAQAINEISCYPLDFRNFEFKRIETKIAKLLEKIKTNSSDDQLTEKGRSEEIEELISQLNNLDKELNELKCKPKYTQELVNYMMDKKYLKKTKMFSDW